MPEEKNFSFNSDTFSGSTNIIVTLLAILSIAAPVILPKLIIRDWGFNQIYFLPDILFYIWILFALVVLAIVFVVPKRHFISNYLGYYFWGEKKEVGRLITIIIFLVLFVLFRFEAHYYGEGFIKISNIAGRSQPLLHWYDFGGTAIPYLFYLILKAVGLSKLIAGTWAYQILSFISGIVFILFSFKISQFFLKEDNDRITFLLILLFSGLSLFFFGLIETVPMFLALMILFIYWIFQLTQSGNKKFLFHLWILFILSLFINLQGITLLPALIYLTIRKFIKRKQFAAFLGTLAAFIFILIAIPIVYVKSIGNMYMENLLLYFSGKPPEVDYSLFSISHLVDLVNIYYLLIPVFGILTFFIIRSFASLRKDPNFAALGFLTLAQFIFLFIIDPKDGMARDLDNYVFLISGFIFWGAYSIFMIKEKINLSQSLLMSLCPLSLVIILPMMYVHLTPSASGEYLDDFLSYNEIKYESAIFAQRDYYSSIGDYDKAIQVERTVKSKAPGALESNLINDLYAHQRVDEAFEYAIRLTERNPYNGMYRMQKGNLLKYYGRYAEAEEELKTAIELEPYRVDFYHFLSELYRETKQETKCLETLNNALSFAPDDKMLVVDLAGYYYRAKKLNIVDSLSQVLFKIDSLEPYIYMYQGLVADGKKQKQTALNLYEKFIEVGDQLPEAPVIRRRINNLFLELRDSSVPDSTQP